MYFGNIPKSKGINIPELRQTLESRFGPIENIRVVKRNIASSTHAPNDTFSHSSSEDLVTDIVSCNYENSVVFIHFYNINSAIRTVQELSMDPDNPYKIFYGKDRCAKISRYQREFVASYLCSPDPDAIDDSVVISMLSQRALAALEINTSTAHISAHPSAVDNTGNRTFILVACHRPSRLKMCVIPSRATAVLSGSNLSPTRALPFSTFIELIAAAEYYMV